MPPFNLRALGRAAGIARRREYIKLAPPALGRATGVSRQHHPSVGDFWFFRAEIRHFHHFMCRASGLVREGLQCCAFH